MGGMNGDASRNVDESLTLSFHYALDELDESHRLEEHDTLEEAALHTSRAQVWATLAVARAVDNLLGADALLHVDISGSTVHVEHEDGDA
jgi:hypothetical protein